MSLEGPLNIDNADLRKIHDEVAQIVRQRMTNTTFAITLLGIFGIFAIPKIVSSQPSETTNIIRLLLVSSILLSCILFILYIYNHCLNGMLRIFTTYLRVTEKSGWEQDWSKYRKKYFYFGYTKAQTVIFLILILISTFWPSIIANIYSIEIQSSKLFGINLFDINRGLGVIFFVVVLLIGFCGLWDIENKVKDRWQTIKDDKDDNAKDKT